MSISQVTHNECVNRMIAIKDSEQSRSVLELKVLSSLPSAIEEFLAKGGQVKQLPPMAMEDPQSNESVQRRKDRLRQYDLNQKLSAMKAERRG